MRRAPFGRSGNFGKYANSFVLVSDRTAGKGNRREPCRIMLWLLIFVISSAYSTNKVCPGGFTCTDTSTCCQLADKSYGCCPLKDAVCCDDHIHCCPQNTKCAAGMCVQLNDMNVTSHDTCFGTEFTCPDGSTCCKGKTPGTFGCCSLEQAVCCSDGTHCCPKDTICDLETETCKSTKYVSKMYDSYKNKPNVPRYTELSQSIKSNITSVICPGGAFQCPNGYTCCQLPSGEWGCCPFEKGVCCKDHLHCCPEFMKCDFSSKSCTQGFTSIPFSKTKIAEPINETIICPDETECSELQTCCMTSIETYGCCIYPNAVCCPDFKHCCPTNYICDVEARQCLPPEKNVYLIS